MPWWLRTKIKARNKERARISRLRPGPIWKVRERKFVDAYFARLMALYAALPVRTKIVPRELLVAAAKAATRDGGYRGKVESKRSTNTAKALLKLPRIQNALDEKFNAVGLTLDRSFEIMATIAENSEVSAADRLRAIDMRIKMTVGYAPTRSASITANVTPDQFFDATFEGKPPDIAIETHDADPE